MTESSSQVPGHVDLATMTSGLHVLGVAPAWSAVERALARLDSARASGASLEDAQVKEDLQKVREFHELLGRSAETLALAILCGAVLGQAAAPEGFGEKLLAGLRAISHSYGFDRLGEADRRQRLEDLRRKLKAEGLVPKSVYGIPKGVKRLDPSRWAEWCQRLRRVAEESPAADRLRTELHVFRERAWSVWRDRLAPHPSFDRASWPRVEPVLADLVCAAAGVSPASRLDLDLGRMNLVAWSEAVFWAQALGSPSHPQTCPGWLAAPALFRLGFRAEVPSGAFAALVELVSSLRLESRPLEEELLAWLGSWERFLGRASQNDRPTILIIRGQEETLISSWKVARRGGILALTRDELAQLSLIPQTSNSLSWLRIDLVAVEAREGLPKDLFELGVSAQQLFSTTKRAPILLARDSSISVGGGVPVIHNAKNADDLIDRALPFFSRPVT